MGGACRCWKRGALIVLSLGVPSGERQRALAIFHAAVQQRAMRSGKSRPWRTHRMLGVAFALVATVLAILAWRDTTRDPIVRRTQVTLAGLDPGDAPIKIALISDIHVAGPDMPPERLKQVVQQINALSPDIVLIAGDLIGDRYVTSSHYSPEQAVAPLGDLAAPLGVFVVPGNHDHSTNLPALASAMRRHGLRLLVNDAAQAGPLVIGGLDDAHTGRADIPETLMRMAPFSGGRVILSHSPDAFPLIPSDVGLTLAGHTHCGQIGWPWGGAPLTMSRYGQRYACGRVNESGKVLVTTAGLGTSGLPVRLFAPPDIWLIKARPPSP